MSGKGILSTFLCSNQVNLLTAPSAPWQKPEDLFLVEGKTLFRIQDPTQN